MIFSRSSLRKLAPHLDECLKTVVVSYNEDVEVGRCVSKMLKLQCTWSWEVGYLIIILLYVFGGGGWVSGQVGLLLYVFGGVGKWAGG